jgi:hypothetical protein
MVGLGGFEPPTSPLSGVRSNQLSYRPIAKPAPTPILIRERRGREGREPAQAYSNLGKRSNRDLRSDDRSEELIQ